MESSRCHTGSAADAPRSTRHITGWIAALGIALAAASCATESEPQTSGLSPRRVQGFADAVDADGGAEGVGWTICPSDFLEECAWLPVPIDRAQPDGPALPIFVSRHLAASGAATSQLWLLQGGPGASASAWKPVVEQLLAAVLPDVDIYVLEQRGVGESARLGCPAQEAPNSEGADEITQNEWPACFASLLGEWGERLASFTTTADSEDLASLIELTREPGKKVFVYGWSYGTARALRLLQTHPDSVDGVILDSVVSPGVQYLSEYDLQYDPVARELSALCAEDAVCGAKLGPDPWGSLNEVAYALAAGACPAFLHRTQIPAYASLLLEHPLLRTHLFPLAYRLARCEPGDVAVVEHYLSALDDALEVHTNVVRPSPVLQLHISLSELWRDPPPSQAELEERCASVTFCPEVSVGLGGFYDIWPRYPRDQYADQWPTTTTPILAMNGTLDPQTPIEKAQVVATRLTAPNQTFVGVPLSPHGVLLNSAVNTPGAPPCGAQMLSGFIGDPTAPPNTECLSDLAPLSFGADLATTLRFFGTTDMWENTLGAAPAGARATPARPRSLRPPLLPAILPL